jgi:hypothetical protein
MIAVAIVGAWLALTGAALLTLAALGRVADRHDFEAQLGVIGSRESSRLRSGGRLHGGRTLAQTRPVTGPSRMPSWPPPRRPAELGFELSRSGGVR